MRIVSLLILTALLLAGCQEARYTGPRRAREVSEDTWEERVLKARGPVLVDFYADWCGPCRRMEPVVESVAGDYAVYKLDYDQYRSVAARYQVNALPTFLIFHDGRVARRLVGMQSEEDLRAALAAVAGGG